jgi:large subunit ribosomal protein L23
MIKPILTEKGLKLAKEGKYSFWLDRALSKSQIKNLIGELFAVHVVSVRTLNFRGRIKTNVKRVKIKIPARKKAIISLKEGEKIDLFETKKGKKKKA